MATTEEVRKLAALARITVPEEDLERFTKEFDSILAYVGQLEKLELPKDLKDTKPSVRNVFREDGEPTETGTWTEKLAQAFPAREGDALSVKQIISHDE
jgi:aspartyl/glutamyl-tRNA(Asn/Gln) amidotransferase C subunit